MEYVSAGTISIITGIAMAIFGLYLLAHKVVPAIGRAVKRFDAGGHEIHDINLEEPALESLCRIALLTNRRDRQWAIDTLYFNGQLPSYVPDGMRDIWAIATVILSTQAHRNEQLDAYRERADRYAYATA
jgi:hypothetical protein